MLAPPTGSGPVDKNHRIQLATAVLLVEVMNADAEVGAAERQAVVDALRRKFSLAEPEIQAVLTLAERSQREATDFYAFTSALNAHFDVAQKLRVIEAM